MLIYEFHSPTLHYLFIDLQLSPLPPSTSIWLLYMKHTVAIIKCLLKNCHHPCCLLLHFGVASDYRFCMVLVGLAPAGSGAPAEHPGPEQCHPELTPSSGSAWARAGTSGVPGCRMGPMARSPFLWQQWQRSLLHLRGSQVVLVLPTVHGRNRNRSVNIFWVCCITFSCLRFSCYALEQIILHVAIYRDCVLGCLWAGAISLHVLCRGVFEMFFCMYFYSFWFLLGVISELYVSLTAGAGIFGALQGERQLRDHDPCVEDIWLPASPEVVLGLLRNREAKYCNCCEKFYEKSDILKINVLHMQYEFTSVTGTSNNSQKQTDSYERVQHMLMCTMVGHAHYVFCQTEFLFMFQR